MILGVREGVGSDLNAGGFEELYDLGAAYGWEVFEKGVDGVARLQAVGEVFDRHAGA